MASCSGLVIRLACKARPTRPIASPPHSSLDCAPSKSGETREIAISGNPLAAVFDGKRGQPCILHEISRRVDRPAQVRKDRPVPQPGLNNPAVRLIQQSVRESNYVRRPGGSGEDPGMRRDPDDRSKNLR